MSTLKNFVPLWLPLHEQRNQKSLNRGEKANQKVCAIKIDINVCFMRKDFANKTARTEALKRKRKTECSKNTSYW